MTNQELNELGTRIWLACDGDDLPTVNKLLRSIEIAALREARELVEKHTIWAADHETEEPVNIPNPALSELDRLIRETELK